MATRSFRGISTPVFVPKWGVLQESFRLSGTQFDVTKGGDVLVQFKPGGSVDTATVMKIVADKDTGEVREISLVLQGDNRQWRTVTPDKLRRVPRNRQEEIEDMQISAHEGELPKAAKGSKRQPSPFDPAIAAGGRHKVTLDKGEAVASVKNKLRSAARAGGRAVETAFKEDEGKYGTLYFEVVDPRPRTKK